LQSALCRLDWDKEGATMPRENYVAKQQRSASA
jgi:hypothetical protein